MYLAARSSLFVVTSPLGYTSPFAHHPSSTSHLFNLIRAQEGNTKTQNTCTPTQHRSRPNSLAILLVL